MVSNVAKRDPVEILLERVELDLPATLKKKTCNKLLVCKLIWPRPGIAEKSVVTLAEFKNDVADRSSVLWSERILFKESVQGSFGFQFSVSTAITEGDLDSILAYLGRTMAKTAADGLDDLIQSLPGIAFVGTMAGYMSKWMLAEAGSSVRVVGEGMTDLSLSDLDGVSSAGRRIEIPLAARTSVDQIRTSSRTTRSPARKRVLIKKGTLTGNLAIRLQMCQ